MTTLLYHARQIGPICKKIAAKAPDNLRAVCDKTTTQIPMFSSTVIRWDSTQDAWCNEDINKKGSVILSRNKRDSRLAMGDLTVPTWVNLGDLKFPCLMRPKRHYGAHGFYVVKDLNEARTARRKCGGSYKWYASPIIDKKTEYRVFVFQDYCVKVVRRYHDDPSQIAWNIANGGKSARLKRSSWPLEVVKRAILAGRVLDLDWYAADVIVSQGGKVYVLELNTAPGLGRDETFKTLAKLFVWAGENPKPQACPGNSWQDLLHPALRGSNL